MLCDSVSTAGQAGDKRILLASKSNEQSDLVSLNMSSVDIILQRLPLSKRQFAKFGIRFLKAPLGSLKIPMCRDSETWQTILLV